MISIFLSSIYCNLSSQISLMEFLFETSNIVNKLAQSSLSLCIIILICVTNSFISLSMTPSRKINQSYENCHWYYACVFMPMFYAVTFGIYLIPSIFVNKISHAEISLLTYWDRFINLVASFPWQFGLNIYWLVFPQSWLAHNLCWCLVKNKVIQFYFYNEKAIIRCASNVRVYYEADQTVDLLIIFIGAHEEQDASLCWTIETEMEKQRGRSRKRNVGLMS